MRIVILSGSVPTTTFIDTLINTMAEDGFDMVVIGKKTGDYHYHKNVHVTIIPEGFISRLLFIVSLVFKTGFKYFGKINADSSGLKELYTNLLFYLPIIDAKPDKIHIQWTAFIHNRDLLFDLFPQKIIVSLRGAHINYTPITTPEIKESYLRLLPKVHKFHAVSNAIAKESEQYGTKREDIHVVYSCISTELLQKEIKSKENSEVLKIISVGRFFWKKGYEYALDTLYLLKEKVVAFKYTLIAEGKTPASILYQLHQLGLNDHVRIVNGASHEEVLKQIELHDVLLLPSVEEGIANVILEAMAAGTPIIGTDTGGINEVIKHGESGFIVRARDTHDMCEQLIAFNTMNAEQRFTIAEHAKNKIREQHNMQLFRKSFADLYNS